MSSMIDQVREVEEQAALIRQEAIVKGRELIILAQTAAQDSARQEAEAARISLRDAEQKAEAEGEALAATILAKREEKAAQECFEASLKLPEAVSYLVERVVSEQ